MSSSHLHITHTLRHTGKNFLYEIFCFFRKNAVHISAKVTWERRNLVFTVDNFVVKYFLQRIFFSCLYIYSRVSNKHPGRLSLRRFFFHWKTVTGTFLPLTFIKFQKSQKLSYKNAIKIWIYKYTGRLLGPWLLNFLGNSFGSTLITVTRLLGTLE